MFNPVTLPEADTEAPVIAPTADTMPELRRAPPDTLPVAVTLAAPVMALLRICTVPIIPDPETDKPVPVMVVPVMAPVADSAPVSAMLPACICPATERVPKVPTCVMPVWLAVRMVPMRLAPLMLRPATTSSGTDRLLAVSVLVPMMRLAPVRVPV